MTELTKILVSGAINYNLEDGTFEKALPTLDPSKHYNLYCHSGRRAGIALSLMTSKGFTSVTNLGGIADAAKSTGLAVVTGA